MRVIYAINRNRGNNKYGNKKVVHDGIEFDYRKEMYLAICLIH